MAKDFYHDQICANSPEVLAEREYDEGMQALYENYRPQVKAIYDAGYAQAVKDRKEKAMADTMRMIDRLQNPQPAPKGLQIPEAA